MNAPGYDYRDGFVVPLAPGDRRTVEELARAGFERAPLPVRVVVIGAQRFVLGLRPHRGARCEHILGWRIVAAAPDRIRLESSSPLYDAVLVGHLGPGPSLGLSTRLRYRRRVLSRLLWGVVGPVHRWVAPYLLRRAAAQDHG